MATATATSLSTNDQKVLSALFDPEALPSSISRAKEISHIDASLPPHPHITPPEYERLEAQQASIISSISSNEDAGHIHVAIQQVDDVIKEYPDYASAYANRAMLQRMALEASIPKDSNLFTTTPSAEIDPLFSDLSTAISLSLPTSPSSPVSPPTARILRTAFAHRALLYLKASESLESGVKISVGGEAGKKGIEELEELASKDFAAAARYGDEVAREMSVRTNPWAKMCGAIVQGAMREEMGG